jgi:L-lactate dehydrogenase complex protein LldG
VSLETGDRAAFVARLRNRLAAAGPTASTAHPMAPPLDGVPLVRSVRLDADDVVGSFVRNATAVRALVHDIDGGAVPPALIDEIIERHHVRRAVVTPEPDVDAVAARLVDRNVDVSGVTVGASAAADLGVTSAVSAIATTGTLVQDSTVAGGRSASLLPPAHLCVLPASRIVATSADVLRSLGDGRALPANLVLITGPSRSGDIEQIMTLGVHGPLAVEIVVLRGA